MLWVKGFGIAVLAAFYGIYIAKMLLQKRKGIRTDQIAKKRKKDKVYYTERAMQIATFAVIAAELVSIFLVRALPPVPVLITGGVLSAAGVGIFGAAVYTMRDSWRAGIPEDDKTEIITEGIYRFSRTPAFLGFDLVYFGLMLLFWNIPLMLCSIWAAVMLHLQILQEEAFLPTVFGEDYLNYRAHVGRYLGKK